MPRQQTVKGKSSLADKENGVGLVKAVQKFCLGGKADEQRGIQQKSNLLGVFPKAHNAAERGTQVTQAAIAQGALACNGDGMGQVEIQPGICKQGDGALLIETGGDIG